MGLATVALVCDLGALSNVGVASYLFDRHTLWALSALAGIVVGAVRNYGMTASYTWAKNASQFNK